MRCVPVVPALLIVLLTLLMPHFGSAFSPSRTHGMRVKRVVGGRNALRGEVPYQVLVNNCKTKQICGGTIIHHSFILTARHCADKGQWKYLEVEAGLVCSTERLGVPRRRVAKAYFPELRKTAKKNTDAHFQGDIALLKMDVPFARDYVGIEPIRIREDPGFEGADCTVSGWGAKEENGTTTVRLQLTQIPILPRKTCKKLNHGRLSGDLMCAGFLEGGADSCQGDSGGPLVCEGLLTGVVKKGIGCGAPGYPGKYTEVAQYGTWIANIISNTTHNSRLSTDGRG